MNSTEIPESAFTEIIKELERQPIPINYYRSKSGHGRSQAFGLIHRWYLPPDYSRMCWKRANLYKLLLDFADKYVSIPYTSITLNQNYQAGPHYDKGNVGESFLVAFGDYSGGELVVHDSEIKGTYNIQNKPIVYDFSKALHSVTNFEGNRYSLVFYTLDTQKRGEVMIPKPSVKEVNGKWVFFRGEEAIDKKKGLPYPKRNKIDLENNKK
jgi:hypothetical protein